MDNIEDYNEILCFINIFRFTIRASDIKQLEELYEKLKHSDNGETSHRIKLICLDLSHKLSEKKVIDSGCEKPWDKLQQILFERLMIDDYSTCEQVTVSVPSQHSLLIPIPASVTTAELNPSDSQILRYLYGCYYRLNVLRNSNYDRTSQAFSKLAIGLDKAELLILDQVILYLTEPDLFPDREKRSKNNQQAPVLLNLVSHILSKGDDIHLDTIQKFVNSIGETCKPLGDVGYDAIIGPTYARLSQKYVSMAIDDPTIHEWFNVAKIFIQQPDIANKFLERNTLKKDNSLAYQSTLLGFMLSVSPLPRTSQVETTFFKNPIRFGESDHKFTETQLGIKLQSLGQELHKIFHALLKLPSTRTKFLSWMGRCLSTFKDRKKMWNNQVLMRTTTISVNDGFLLNFFTVMLHLCEPFAGPYNSDILIDQPEPRSIDKKLLKVDPRYCRWSKATYVDCPAHFLGLSEETFLIGSSNPTESDIQSDLVQPNFITECFFGTHQAFTYGFRSVYERFFRLAQAINDLQHTYADVIASAPPGPLSGPDPREVIKDRIDSSMTQFFNLKTVLMVPNRVTMQMHFCIATAAYLNHLVACQTYEEAIEAQEFKTITLQTLQERKVSRVCLEFIPEMLIENVLDFFVFLKHFNEQALARASGILEPLMTLIITFMGNSSLIQNPHLRARFAEILECLMPHQSLAHPNHHRPQPVFVGCPSLFEDHPLVQELVPSLVNVFVSIEMTGEGVQFEQKFSYRRPMYVVLEYLWDRPVHRKKLIDLADEAEKNIDSARPPLFLRFINLLMNDAIFLLDEALNYMGQLRELERRRKSEEWSRLSPQQRALAEDNYSHVGKLARFHNVLSLATIGTLAWLTNEIKTIFSHATLVDRVANMLNYFLEHLVGPKKGKFNVNDKNDYEFKPREILEKICRIYINLGHEDTNKKFREFCSAVSSDGRSYSENLLPQATNILYRTGMMSIGTEFEKLSQLVRKIAILNQMDEIPTENIPDTFLDPIMSTLMVDPVLLPSSHIIVDRSTIARHLLSDQTDPFNRSPLSMEDVIPDTDLKKQIESFLKEQRELLKTKSGSQDDCKDQGPERD